MVHFSARILRGGPAAAILAVSALIAASCGSTPPTGPPPIPQLTVTCPPAMEGQSETGEPVAVTFNAPQTTGGQAPVTLACNPQSGSMFPGGTTTVQCTATDSRNVTATCSLVRVPPRLLGTARVLAFGDSITAGTDGGGSLVPGAVDGSTETPFAYPRVLDTMLVDRYKLQSPIVFARGVPGEYAEQGRARLVGTIAQTRPDILLLMEGTNNLLFGTAGAADAAISLRLMVQHAKSQNVRVLLATVPPQRAGGQRNRDFMAALVPVLNESIRTIAKEENVPLVDIYDVFIKDMSLIGSDDLHPTARGFRVIAETFFKVIQESGEQPPPALTGRMR
jgi:lysophospholipase L1-like esterase